MIEYTDATVPDAMWLRDTDFGWKARLGLVTPSLGWTIEHEWPRMLPRGVSYLVTRVPLTATTPEALMKMGEHAVEAAALLGPAGVDLVCYGCTIETILQGIAYERDLTQSLAKAAGVPAITMAGAVVDALRHMEVSRLAMVTPYTEDINEREKHFLESLGIHVVYDKCLGISKTIDIGKLSPQSVFDLGVEASKRAPQSEALFFSCGNLRTVEVIAALEQTIGKPVISSNQAMLWAALKVVGFDKGIRGFGSLLDPFTQISL